MAASQARRTHCPRGHEYDAANTYIYRGKRDCRACHRERWCARARPKPTLAEIVWTKFEREKSCWVWTGYVHATTGYGYFRRELAHRLVYELLVEPIPDGLTLDHLCRNHACVNPSHLEPVTLAVNVMRGEGPMARNARKTHCPQGHAYDEANTYIVPGTPGHRQCRACNRARAASLQRARVASRA